ncbi:MAG: electron transport complex subunit RsxG [Candidatus Competibacteraceae bacterium]|jgi:electron transport complex protein RnfG|nr:electron transport complex subunit RsxG [Candidatus Competibacteraceae bacterium]
MAVAALVLVSFAVLGTGLVALTFKATEQIIADNEQAALLANLNALVPPAQYDNALTEDLIWITDQGLLGTEEPVPVYRAFKDGKPVAMLATPVAPDGYSGTIKLLVGVYADGTLAGVRVLAHKETPGLGDAIEATRSDWVLTFSGKSLGNPQPKAWAVKKDGGVFDQFTGATITPRAVVKAVRQFLVYFQQHRDRLLANPANAQTGEIP